VLHVVVVALTWRDLDRRTPAEVRGPKWLWRAASSVQMGNAALYWLFGRRRATGGPEGPPVA
jgi:hypothetical protein